MCDVRVIEVMVHAPPRRSAVPEYQIVALPAFGASKMQSLMEI